MPLPIKPKGAPADDRRSSGVPADDRNARIRALILALRAPPADGDEDIEELGLDEEAEDDLPMPEPVPALPEEEDEEETMEEGLLPPPVPARKRRPAAAPYSRRPV